MIHYDVAIAGAGPAGAVAAALLARGGASVALFDRARPPGDRIGESPAERRGAGAGKLKLPGPPTDPRHRPVKGVISAWGGAPVVHDYMNDPDGCGWRLDRTAFDQALLRAGASSGARLMHSPLHSLTRSGRRWHLQPAESAELTADQLVDATGRRAVVRRHVGAKRNFQEPLVAVWSVGRRMEPGTAVTDRTLIQSEREGWWYGAVLPDRRPIAAFHCSPETAKRFRRAPRDWLIALEERRGSGPMARHWPIHRGKAAFQRCLGQCQRAGGRGPMDCLWRRGGIVRPDLLAGYLECDKDRCCRRFGDPGRRYHPSVP